MLFPTGEFGVFFLIAFALSWITSKHQLSNKIVLLILSYIFYSWWDYRFSFLLAASSFANYSLALFLEAFQDKRTRKIILVIACGFNLIILGFFKYVGFFQSSFNDLLHLVGLSREIKIFEVLLPVGVSFFTFQGISYVVDVYKGHIRACLNPVDVLLYNSFFPHLVAGPIVRAKDFLPQLAQPPNPAQIFATKAFFLIGIGLFKKIVLAHVLAVEVVGPVFESPKSHSSLDLLLGAYGYAFQIYFDFSAYSDIAIGTAYLLGFEFKRNFNQPYRAVSLSDFWKRWHISLSSFLKDYLYVPLGGSRHGILKTYRNLLMTMVLGGLWHGASWNFVIWGLIHGFGLILEKEFARWNLVVQARGVGKYLRQFVVFHGVCLAWIFFNAESLSVAREYLVGFADFPLHSKIFGVYVGVIFAIAIIGQMVPEKALVSIENQVAKIPLAFQGATLGFVVVFLSALSPSAVAPFIYFKF